MVVDNGGTVSSVKKGLSFLVQADPSSTSSKSVKAKSLGIEIIAPEDFLAMIEG
jgi:NAD-dependent DNA ligase